MKSQRLLSTLLAALLLIAVTMVLMAQDAPTSPLRVANAWARPGEETSAVYLHITNTGEEADQLAGVETAIAMAEIHETRMQNDIMQMRQIEALVIPAGETIVLEPGGTHIMLMNLNEALVEGGTLPLTLNFASGMEVDVQARISHTPIPQIIEADALSEQARRAVSDGSYVGQVINPPIRVQDFVAHASDAHLTRLSDTDGQWRVIFFGYMHCPDFCPLTLVDYRDVKALLEDAASEVQFMFISVDSIRDKPEAMRLYLDNFDPEFIGFAPDDATLVNIQPDYGFYYERRMDSGTQAIYTVDHSTRSYLLDRDGVLRASFAYDTEPEDIADALFWYLDHE